jgi:voltage-gated potassium channel
MSPHVTPQNNFSWLLIALVLLLFADALFTQLESEAGSLLVNLSLLVTLVVAVWSLDRAPRKWRNWKIGVSVVIAALMIGDSIIESRILGIAQLTGSLFILSLSLSLAWKQVLFTGSVDSNKIVGAICIYILLGVIWAFGYLVAEELFPGSFNGLGEDVWQNNLEPLIYYSMVTLTTLGYGDITPALPLARFLAYMEALTGIFYTTILVASLIGMQLSGKGARTSTVHGS